MKYPQRLFAISAVTAAAIAAPVANASPIYSATFQGVTFTITQIDANTVTFGLTGGVLPDWSTATYLAAFDFKGFGLDFSLAGGATGTAFGPGTPGYVDSSHLGTGLLGQDSQLSASNTDCAHSTGQDDTICFDIFHDVALTPSPSSINMLYTIDFNQNFNIQSTGPHLQIAFSAVQDGNKVGSLYSQDIPLTSSSGSSGPSSGSIPEPNSSDLALLGVALLGTVMWRRRRQS